MKRKELKLEGRLKLAKEFGVTEPFVKEARTKYCWYLSRENFKLTFEEFLKKLIDSKIGPWDIGRTKGKYHLSRYYDEGDYTPDNCRFIQGKYNRRQQNRYGNNKLSGGYYLWVTPLGRFGSCADAGVVHGVNKSLISKWVIKGKEGFYKIEIDYISNEF